VKDFEILALGSNPITGIIFIFQLIQQQMIFQKQTLFSQNWFIQYEIPTLY
jgi:hypothetical protein